MAVVTGRMRTLLSVYYSLDIPEQGDQWPLLLTFHGYGQNIAQFAPVFHPLVDSGIMVATPQAPHQFYVKLESRTVGFSWLTRYQRDRSIEDFTEYLCRFYERIKRDYPVSPGGVWLLGFSQGVSMAYRLWTRNALPVEGIFACGADLPPDVEKQLDRLKPLPVCLIHGTQDRTVPVKKAHYARRVLERHGYPVDQFFFDGGHRIPSRSMKVISSRILQALPGHTDSRTSAG